ncbi:PepSY domain-containing protein [Kocuria flava]|uniref:PepSY domain-containing protein n=1 Tax=Kocuria flava TaxID=446860 RepID=UPI001FF1E4C9|nr:PepSY domain-containing protein [Kocuria flava]MCJ8504824.1 PepSY domain-containing protein [Kocuria flava]
MKHTDKKVLSMGALTLSALLLAGCGDGGGGGEETTGGSAATEATGGATATAEQSASGSPSASESAGGTASPSASGSASGSPSATPSGGAEVGAVTGAIVAAEEDVTGGQAFEIDRKDAGEGWEVTLAVEDREQEVEVSADGEQVTPQETDDELDPADRDNLAAVQVPLEDAVRTALNEVDGTLDSAELDTEDGVVVWEVDVDESDGTSVDVHINAENGSVLKVDR